MFVISFGEKLKNCDEYLRNMDPTFNYDKLKLYKEQNVVNAFFQLKLDMTFNHTYMESL